MSKRKRNEANIDRKLNRTLIVLSIVTCLIFIGSSVAALMLTTVSNEPPSPPPAAVTAIVRISANGISYTQETFKDANVSGTILFIATIKSGDPTGVQLEVYPEVDTQGSGNPVLTKQFTKDSPVPGETYHSWRLYFDSTQLDNGVYWFFVRAKTSTSSGITLSIFGFSQNDSGGSGEAPPLQIAWIILVAVLVIIVVVGMTVVIMYLMKRR
jgi:flagellar basal body-associated protein FliL